MHLVMFDIDGTLTASNEYDAECYIKAIKDILNIEGINPDWSVYRHVTDGGIASEIIEQYKKREATKAELDHVLSRFMFHLKAELRLNPERFTEIPGAISFFQHLNDQPDIAVALATGGWKESAIFKLVNSGFNTDSIPMASSNDAITREEIMQIAQGRAGDYYGVKEFRSKIFIGDGIWDLQASAKSGYNFIGIGSKTKELKKHGASNLFKDYLMHDDFYNTLRSIQNT